MRTKRTILILLFICFATYTVLVYVVGTEVQPISTQLNTNKSMTGKQIFQNKNCIACHQLFGLGGYLGPELTTVISQKGKGEEYARAFLKGGSQRMPNFHFSTVEMDAIIEYLKTVDASASSYKQ